MDTVLKYPKTLETREDYDYVIKNFPREMWLPDYKEVFDSGFYNKVIGKNVVITDGIASYDDVDDEEVKEIQSNSAKWKNWTELSEKNHLEFSEKYNNVIQYKGKLYVTAVRVNPDSNMAKLGFTEDEAYGYMLGLTQSDLNDIETGDDINEIKSANETDVGSVS